MTELKKILHDVRTALDTADTALDALPSSILPAKIIIARTVLDAARRLIDALDDGLASP